VTSYTNVFTGALVAPALAAYNPITLTSLLQLQWPLETAPNSNLATPIIDITAASTGSFGLILPPATNVGVGTFIIVNNLSSFGQTVYANGGATSIGTQAAGTVFFYYLQNNTTAAGSWFAFQYGAAISAPSVAAIAGAGLTTVGAQLAQNISVSQLSVNYTAGAGDRDKFFVWTAGTGTITLPASATVGAGWYIQVRNTGTAILTVALASGSDNINGTTAGTSLSMNPGDSAFFVTDGLGDWYTIGLGPSVTGGFNVVTISLTGAGSTYILSGTQLNQVGYTFTGVLSNNVMIVVPSTKQEYWVRNSTTGSFTLSIGTSGQASPPGIGSGSGIYYSDGSNVYLATPASAVTIPVSIGNGGTGATSAPSALVNLGGTSTGIAVFEASSPQAAQTTLLVPSFADMTAAALVM
jgi:hypothetical protein